MGRENTTILIIAYDEQMLLPLLMEVYKSSLPFLKNLKHLNPQMVAILEICFTPLAQLPTHNKDCWKRTLWLLLISNWCKHLQMCLNLVVDQRAQVSNNCQLPTWQDRSWASQLARLKSNKFFNCLHSHSTLQMLPLDRKPWQVHFCQQEVTF